MNNRSGSLFLLFFIREYRVRDISLKSHAIVVIGDGSLNLSFSSYTHVHICVCVCVAD